MFVIVSSCKVFFASVRARASLLRADPVDARSQLRAAAGLRASARSRLRSGRPGPAQSRAGNTASWIGTEKVPHQLCPTALGWGCTEGSEAEDEALCGSVRAASYVRLARSTAKLTPDVFADYFERGEMVHGAATSSTAVITELAAAEERADEIPPGSSGSSAASHAVKACGRSAEEILYELAHFATPDVRCRAFAAGAEAIKDACAPNDRSRSQSALVPFEVSRSAAHLHHSLAPLCSFVLPPAFVR